jgi:lipopolysaccharide transport system permease protein
MQNFSASPREMIASFWRNRILIASLVEREVIGRYRGSYLGIFWSLLNPLIMLLIYTFVFGEVFNVRWGLGSNSKTEFATILFAGLIVFNFFAECIIRAPSTVLLNVSYVKKVVFPLEILPIVTIGAALFHMVLSILVWFVFSLYTLGLPPTTVVFFPMAVIPLLFFSLGLSWFLSSLGVYLRDISQVIGLSVTALMFLSPIFYPLSSLPQQYQFIFELNPLTPAIEIARGVLVKGELPGTQYFLLYSLTMFLCAWLGFFWFQLTRKGFADVL